jgi:hypothetical protein
MEELNQQEDELKDSLTPEEDLEDDDLDFLDEEPKKEPEESQEPDGSQKALELLNTELKKRGLDKNYKSWDDVAKSEKQRDIDFAKKGMEQKKEDKKEDALPSNLSERLLRVEQPDSQFIIDEIKKDHPGKDPYEIWNGSEYYRKEAAVRAENERNKTRITNPSGNSEEQKKVDEMSQKFMKNFPPSVQKAMDKMKKPQKA